MGYDIKWDGHTVTFPPADDTNGALSFTPADGWALRIGSCAASMSDSAPGRPTRISMPVVLIPLGPPNDQVSVAVPRSVADDEQIRHLGFLDKKFVQLIERNGSTTMSRLAELSNGEIHCTAIIERGDDRTELDIHHPGDLMCAYSHIKLDLPSARELGSAISDFGRVRTDHVLDRLRTFETAGIEIGAMSVTVDEGRWTVPSSLDVTSDDVHIGWVALGYLFLRDERQRGTVLVCLQKLGVPVAAPCEPRPEGAASTEWHPNELPNVFVSWGAGGHDFTWVPPDGPSTIPHFRRTFARYNPTTKTLWAEDQRLVAPACVIAARLGLEIVEIGLPPQSWTLRERVRRHELEDLSYGAPPPYKFRELHPRVSDLVPDNLLSPKDLTRLAQIEGFAGFEPRQLKSGNEPTELLEKLTTRRLTLFPNHTYLDVIVACRICERPAGQFRTPLCAEPLAYCHRCLAFAVEGLPAGAHRSARKDDIARATVAVRAIADLEFGGAAFVEAQLITVHGDPEHPVRALDIDRRLLLRIAITRRQLPWTHILIDAGLADNGVRLSRGTVLKAVDGHLCSSMLEKAVDDFLHENGISHTREPLYPFDEQLNPNTRLRADWLLSDGTFVEMWGMPDDPVYAEKMRKKIAMAARHRMRFLGITPADTRRLDAVFADRL